MMRGFPIEPARVGPDRAGTERLGVVRQLIGDGQLQCAVRAARLAMTNGRQDGWLQRRGVLSRRGDLIWTDLAPCVGLRRARSFLLLAGPGVGRRSSKILAENKELWRCDAESGYDAESRRRERRYDAESCCVDSLTRRELAQSCILCRNTSGISAQRRRNVGPVLTFPSVYPPRPPTPPPPHFAQTASAYAESAEAERRDGVQVPATSISVCSNELEQEGSALFALECGTNHPARPRPRPRGGERHEQVAYERRG